MSSLSRAVALVASDGRSRWSWARSSTPAPAGATIPAAVTPSTPTPTPSWGWERVFVDGFDGAAGTGPDQWHAMPSSNWPAQNGQGQLEVGQLAQIRTNQGWVLPFGTQVRVTARLMMPNTGSNYAAFWVQHPNGTDPRELDVIESYGPLKTDGGPARLAHLLRRDGRHRLHGVRGVGVPGRAVVGRPALPRRARSRGTPSGSTTPTFTVGGDTVQFSANDDVGNQAYAMNLNPDLRRVPRQRRPFQLRLSNKDVAGRARRPRRRPA